MENEKNNQEFVHKTSGEPLEDTQAEKAVGGQMECADSDYHGACCPKGVTQETFSRQNRNCYNRDAIYKCDFLEAREEPPYDFMCSRFGYTEKKG